MYFRYDAWIRKYLSCGGGGEVAGAGANGHVLSSRLDFDLSITVVTLFVERVITEHVLRA